ncbi:hypothetical protein QLY72_21960 [Cronobacter malonaticus]|uniref:hypothetical protein n=1 Tax=Cronobacter malonaticus TaxID=413503 RepID=UPI0024AEBBF9|nr:hypothetical protein [Cronobacter malonaticus]MDI7595066.1 hypothetical protein [Cronobacter malonaticus]
MNNDELISAGHELAKCLDSNTRLLDIAKLLSKMATQLDVTTAAMREKTKQCEQLVAENAALKKAFNPEVIPEDAVNAFNDTVIMDHDWNDTGEWSWVENDTDVIRAVMAELAVPETPATDAFLREVRASAVDAACLKISNSIVSCRQDEMIGLDEAVNIARNFAAELRQGGAA